MPRGDTDWFKIEFEDDGWCTINQVKIKLQDIETGVNLEFVGFHDTDDCKGSPGCKSGSVVCDNSDPVCAGLPPGYKGCKSVNGGTTDETIEFDCYAGASSDSGDIYVQVVPSTPDTGTCEEYTIIWDVK